MSADDWFNDSIQNNKTKLLIDRDMESWWCSTHGVQIQIQTVLCSIDPYTLNRMSQISYMKYEVIIKKKKKVLKSNVSS